VNYFGSGFYIDLDSLAQKKPVSKSKWSEVKYEEDCFADFNGNTAGSRLYQPGGRCGYRRLPVAYLRLLWRLD